MSPASHAHDTGGTEPGVFGTAGDRGIYSEDGLALEQYLLLDTVDERHPTPTAPDTQTDTDAIQVYRRPRRTYGARELSWELIQTIVLTLVIFLGVRSVVQNFRVEGASMEPTLHTGQYLLINKIAYVRIDGTPLDTVLPVSTQGVLEYLFGGPVRGDVAVFRAPNQPDKDFIKRVLGLPGDTVLVRSGKVYVNGKPLDEPYIEFTANYNYPISGQAIRVPPDSYFVLGDNRPNSSDSHLGWFVPADNLIGKAWFSYWPPTTWGLMPHAAYAN